MRVLWRGQFQNENMNIKPNTNRGDTIALLLIAVIAIVFIFGMSAGRKRERYYTDPMIDVIRQQQAVETQKEIEAAITAAHNGDVSQYQFLESLNGINPRKTQADLNKMEKIRADWRWENGKPIYIGTNTTKGGL